MILINSPSCPEFPDSEWTNVLAGCFINLDVVLTGYYSTSNNNKQVEEIRDFEIHFGTVNPTKNLSTVGEWNITWNQSSQAICAAFPPRASKLAQYAEYIIGLFAAIDVHFHDCSVQSFSSVWFFAPKMRNCGPQLVQDRPKYWGNRTEPPMTGLLQSMAPVQTNQNRFFCIKFVIPI